MFRKNIRPNIAQVEPPLPELTFAKGANDTLCVVNEDKSKTCTSVPHPNDYQLDDLLAAGISPQEVNVHELLNPTSPEALQSAAEAVALQIVSKLADQKELETVVEKPAPSVEPIETSTNE